MTEITDAATLCTMARNTWETAIVQRSLPSSPHADDTFQKAIAYAQQAIDNATAGYQKDKAVRLLDLIQEDFDTQSEDQTVTDAPMRHPSPA